MFNRIFISTKITFSKKNLSVPMSDYQKYIQSHASTSAATAVLGEAIIKSHLRMSSPPHIRSHVVVCLGCTREADFLTSRLRHKYFQKFDSDFKIPHQNMSMAKKQGYKKQKNNSYISLPLRRFCLHQASQAA